MKVQVRLNNYRRSASKVREIVPIIKGMNVDQAQSQLNVLEKGSAEDLKKLLLSAVAAAKNDFNLNEDNLILENIIVQEGKTLKRWRARAYGRANQILKRTCHIVLTVAEKDVKVFKKEVVKKSEKNDRKRMKDNKSVNQEKIEKKGIKKNESNKKTVNKEVKNKNSQK
jgi:large subunit ribosomal protein L22